MQRISNIDDHKWTPSKYVDPEIFNAAELLRRRAWELKKTILESGHVDATLADCLAIDEAIRVLSARTRAPRLVFTPTMKGSDPATANLHVNVYLGLESAFTAAALVVGGNLAGQLEALRKVKSRLERASAAIDDLGPAKLPQHLNMLFRGNPLPNRRPERALPAMELATSLADAYKRLNMMVGLLASDLKELEGQTGRPPDLQKETFSREVGRLWTKLTGKPPSYKPDSLFANFLQAAWKSGLPSSRRNDSFERVMRRLAKG